MILLLYLLELATLFLVCKNVLHLRKTRSLGKLAVTFFVVIFWAFYIIFSQNTFPNTIALLIAILFFYTEPWYFKCCLVVVYTLFVNIVSNLNIYLYCMITQSDSVKNIKCYLYSDILVLLFIILTSFIVKKYISFPTEPFRYLPGKSCFLILFVAIIDFFLSSVTSLLFYDTRYTKFSWKIFIDYVYCYYHIGKYSSFNIIFSSATLSLAIKRKRNYESKNAFARRKKLQGNT